MGWVVMGERELNRVEVLAQVDDGRLSVDNAAQMSSTTSNASTTRSVATRPSAI